MFTHKRPKILFSSALSLAVSGGAAVHTSRADPAVPAPLTTAPSVPTPHTPPQSFIAAKKKAPWQVSNLTLDYANATKNSAEVLKAKVGVTLPEVTLVAALDALMNASDKTCRVECRQLQAQYLPLNVKGLPMGTMLDTLAKLGGGRLYVLPSKLILAPATALSDEEKKKAKLYGVLLTPATLPDTPEAKALLKPNAQGKTILDLANAKIGAKGDVSLLGALGSSFISSGNLYSYGAFETKLLAGLTQEQVHRSLNVNFHDMSYADVVASYAHSIGCELYLTPDHFVICPPDQLNAPQNQKWTQGAVPAFSTSSTDIAFADLSLSAL